MPRGMTLQEVSVALRPFYFIVHPDRFGRNLRAKEQNEKSLQVLNGYLNDLFPVPKDVRPTSVRFSIFSKDSSLKDIDITLSGTDPVRIVRNALQSCNLNTDNIPVPEPKITEYDSRSFENVSTGFETYTKNINKAKSSQHAVNDLYSRLKSCRDDALQKSRNTAMTRQSLKEIIDDIKRRSGAKEVIWESDWKETHMRSCLGNLSRLLNQTTASGNFSVIHALYKNVLRFGQGSHMCCDGSVQFGADNVPEQWENVCAGLVERRNQLQSLRESALLLGVLLGGAHVVIPYNKSLSRTLDQVQQLLKRLKDDDRTMTALSKLGKGTTVEILAPQDDLVVDRRGHILIPCNTTVSSLSDFFKKYGEKCRSLKASMLQNKEGLELHRKECELLLGLSSLEWEPHLGTDEVMECIKRLRNLDDKTKDVIRGLSLRISSNPSIYVMSNGVVSVTLNWI
ncbi:hypothetical protein Q1695_000146 [Nippostrongylus brasiliensis]|nr:hypothetical protein Q1695_000146 [Nippostrongylus brasiliensis]